MTDENKPEQENAENISETSQVYVLLYRFTQDHYLGSLIGGQRDLNKKADLAHLFIHLDKMVTQSNTVRGVLPNDEKKEFTEHGFNLDSEGRIVEFTSSMEFNSRIHTDTVFEYDDMGRMSTISFTYHKKSNTTVTINYDNTDLSPVSFDVKTFEEDNLGNLEQTNNFRILAGTGNIMNATFPGPISNEEIKNLRNRKGQHVLLPNQDEFNPFERGIVLDNWEQLTELLAIFGEGQYTKRSSMTTLEAEQDAFREAYGSNFMGFRKSKEEDAITRFVKKNFTRVESLQPGETFEKSFDYDDMRDGFNAFFKCFVKIEKVDDSRYILVISGGAMGDKPEKDLAQAILQNRVFRSADIPLEFPVNEGVFIVQDLPKIQEALAVLGFGTENNRPLTDLIRSEASFAISDNELFSSTRTGTEGELELIEPNYYYLYETRFKSIITLETQQNPFDISLELRMPREHRIGYELDDEGHFRAHDNWAFDEDTIAGRIPTLGNASQFAPKLVIKITPNIGKFTDAGEDPYSAKISELVLDLRNAIIQGIQNVMESNTLLAENDDTQTIDIPVNIDYSKIYIQNRSVFASMGITHPIHLQIIHNTLKVLSMSGIPLNDLQKKQLALLT